MSNVINFKNIFQGLERMTKSGNIHAVFRDETNLEGVKEGEIYIDYSYDLNAPVLKVIRNGVETFIYTESDRLFREFLENVFQIGTNSSSNNYGTSIYFKLNNDVNGNTGFNKETVTAFYNEFKDNPELKPYLKHVKKGEDVSKLYPFMDTDHVYFDVSEIFKGKQDVKSVSEVLIEMMSEANKISNIFVTSIEAVKRDILSTKNDFAVLDNERSELLDLLRKTNENNADTIEGLTTHINNLIDNTEKSIRPYDLFLLHDEDVVIPVRFKVLGGKETGLTDGSNKPILEQFMSSLYIASNGFENIAKIGDESMWSGGDFNNTNSQDWVLNKTVNTGTFIYNVEQVGNGEFIVYLRKGRYVIFNKYIDSLVITPELKNESGRPVVPVGTVMNSYINGPLYINKKYTHRFTNGLLISESLAFSSGIKMVVN